MVKGKYRVAEVKWYDASHYSDSRRIEWILRTAHPIKNQTVGYIIKIDKEIIILAHEIEAEAEGEESIARDITIILRRNIIGITYLDSHIPKQRE